MTEEHSIKILRNPVPLTESNTFASDLLFKQVKTACFDEFSYFIGLKRNLDEKHYRIWKFILISSFQNILIFFWFSIKDFQDTCNINYANQKNSEPPIQVLTVYEGETHALNVSKSDLARSEETQGLPPNKDFQEILYTD